MKNRDHWKESLLNYFLSDLGMDLNQTISLPRVFLRCASHYHSKPAVMEKRNGRYAPVAYSEILDQASDFAQALIDLGFKAHDRFALFLKNSPAWPVADFGTMFAGGATVPIYETLIAHAVRHILKDSGAVGVVLEDKNQFEKVKSVWAEVPSLEFVVVRRPEGVALKKDKVLSLEDFLKRGAEARRKKPDAIEKRLDLVRRDDVASIVYTSGTTGDPKGVMLTHRNFLSNVYGVASVTDVNARDIMLSILPLSHVFERTIGYYVPLLFGATVAYAESIDTVSQNLTEVKPTIMCAVPRLFEKIYTRMLKKIDESNPVKKRLFQWAVEVGRQVWASQDRMHRKQAADRRQRHRPEERFRDNGLKIFNPALKVSYALAEKLVYSKLRASMGGRLRFFVSGGAALNPEVITFFRNLNIAIYEGYGMTESSPVISFNYANKFKPGTVGKLLPHVQVKLSPEGEILAKGPNVMKGYFNNPKATAEAIDADGWLHTGDVGVFDEDNYLKITDRIKEIIVMSNGKNVAPLPIENMLTQSPIVANAMAIGNNRKYITALIFPAEAELQVLAKSLGVTAKNFEELCRNKKIVERFVKIVEDVNRDLSRYEQVKKFEIVPHELTVDGGEITPTLKLKRRILDKKFGELIEKMYPAGEG
ncbi:MAG TPA: long-chain fatty acid--CoA ligase [bacterium]|nr:long-chain fatty acid--CoA ligase [bacterium]